MNYLMEIRMFNEWTETGDITTSGIALWHTLVYLIFNSREDISLRLPLSVIMARTKMSRSSVYRERESLRRQGLIDFDMGDGRQTTSYRIISFEERARSHVALHTATQNDIPSHVASHTGTQHGTQTPQFAEASHVASHTGTQNDLPSRVASHTETQHGTQTPISGEASHVASHTETQYGIQTGRAPDEARDIILSDNVLPTEDCGYRSSSQLKKGPYISIYINKEKDKGGLRGKKENGSDGGSAGEEVGTDHSQKSPKKKRPEFDLSFIGDERWEALVESWLEYKRSRSESYKSELSVKKFHTMLRNLSRGDLNSARQILDKSIANNWAGIFELTPDDGRSRNPSVQSPHINRPATGQHIGQIKQPEDEERRQRLLERFGSRDYPKHNGGMINSDKK